MAAGACWLSATTRLRPCRKKTQEKARPRRPYNMTRAIADAELSSAVHLRRRNCRLILIAKRLQRYQHFVSHAAASGSDFEISGPSFGPESSPLRKLFQLRRPQFYSAAARRTQKQGRKNAASTLGFGWFSQRNLQNLGPESWPTAAFPFRLTLRRCAAEP